MHTETGRRRLDEQLAGHWSSAPFDHGAMESSELGFLPDGGGWSLWTGSGGGLDVTRFSWSCPEPGLLELRAHWTTSGEWQATDAGQPWRFAAVHTSEAVRSVTRTRYTVEAVPPPYGGEAIQALLLEEPVEFSLRYARGEPVAPPAPSAATG